MTGRLKSLIFLILLIGIWEAGSRAELWPDYLFPSPSAIGSTLIDGVKDGSILIGIGVSLWRILLGYGLSVVGGVLLGLLIGRVQVLDQTLGVLLVGLQSLPSIAWFPLAILWFGLSEGAILFIVVMGAFQSIVIATDAGVRGISPLYVNVARNLGAKGFQFYWRLLIPATLPAIVTGMKQGWAFAWRSLIAGEMIFGNLGLGYLLMKGRELNNMDEVLAVMVVIIVFGLCVDQLLFRRVEKKIHQRWGMIGT
ncbi:MAG: ABC transporter permease [Deltaproteobacteria bacterium]|nr:ABC transporter permease [Deltaproteobacteria bacterium]